jgi:hypothetical protein
VKHTRVPVNGKKLFSTPVTMPALLFAAHPVNGTCDLRVILGKALKSLGTGAIPALVTVQ